jgi:hypothetical protein
MPTQAAKRNKPPKFHKSKKFHASSRAASPGERLGEQPGITRSAAKG